MGLYDRDYYRRDEPSGILSGRSMVVNLIILTAGVFVAEMLTDQRVVAWLALWSDTLQRPWDWWRLLTYGFVHDPKDIMHILFNMFGLYVFGREIEEVYGRWEFLRFYLAGIVFAGFVWLLAERTPLGQPGPLIGASGGVVAVIVLDVIYAPRRQVLLFGVIPMPAWAFAALFLLGDVFGTMNRQSLTAHSAHLAGAGFAFLYWYFQLNLGRLMPANLPQLLKRRPKLRVHDPDQEDPRELNARVDEILQKIHRSGEGSLTNAERKTLEEASRRYQRRQRS